MVRGACLAGCRACHPVGPFPRLWAVRARSLRGGRACILFACVACTKCRAIRVPCRPSVYARATVPGRCLPGQCTRLCANVGVMSSDFDDGGMLYYDRVGQGRKKSGLERVFALGFREKHARVRSRGHHANLACPLLTVKSTVSHAHRPTSPTYTADCTC